MQSTEFNREKVVLRKIAHASDAIRRKHKLIKLGRQAAETIMDEVFRPVVTPLKKIVNQSVRLENVKKEEKEEKKEMKAEKEEEDADFDNTFKTAYDDDDDDDHDEQATSSETSVEPLVQQYLRMFGTPREKELDTSYGVRKLAGDVLMIGDSPVTFDKLIFVKNKTYEASPGFLELLFKKTPNREIVTAEDIDNYGMLLTDTNAHRKHYKVDKPIRTNSNKYKNIIMDILSSRKIGKALPRYMIIPKKHIDYIYWDDPNELVDRLRLLLASEAAGNTSHNNEIMSIIEELREAQIIY